MKNRIRILIALILVVAMGAALGVIGLQIKKGADELYKLHNESCAFADMINRHHMWRNGLIKAIENMEEFPGSLNPHICAYGNWLKSDVAEGISDPEILALMEELLKPHIDAHENAIPVVKYIDEGNQDAAMREAAERVFPELVTVKDLYARMGERYAVLIDMQKYSVDRLAFIFLVTTVIFVVFGVSVCILGTIFFRSGAKKYEK